MADGGPKSGNTFDNDSDESHVRLGTVVHSLLGYLPDGFSHLLPEDHQNHSQEEIRRLMAR